MRLRRNERENSSQHLRKRRKFWKKLMIASFTAWVWWFIIFTLFFLLLPLLKRKITEEIPLFLFPYGLLVGSPLCRLFGFGPSPRPEEMSVLCAVLCSRVRVGPYTEPLDESTHRCLLVLLSSRTAMIKTPDRANASYLMHDDSIDDAAPVADCDDTIATTRLESCRTAIGPGGRFASFSYRRADM